MARGRCFSHVRDGVYEYTLVVCVCMCVIGVSTCACVPQLCSQSLGTLQLGSAACIHAFQLPQTSSTRHSCLCTRCLHVYASQPTAPAHIELCGAIRSSNQPRWRSIDCNPSLSCSSAAKYVYGLVRTLSAGHRNNKQLSGS
jgi:hypothetical protein